MIAGRLSLRGLPGRELIERGVQDARAARTTVEALLVIMAAPRLEALGVLGEGEVKEAENPELRLYRLLGEAGILDPYSQYNALRRELSSFVRALEQRVTASSEDASRGSTPS